VETGADHRADQTTVLGRRCENRLHDVIHKRPRTILSPVKFETPALITFEVW